MNTERLRESTEGSAKSRLTRTKYQLSRYGTRKLFPPDGPADQRNTSSARYGTKSFSWLKVQLTSEIPAQPVCIQVFHTPTARAAFLLDFNHLLLFGTPCGRPWLHSNSSSSGPLVQAYSRPSFTALGLLAWIDLHCMLSTITSHPTPAHHEPRDTTHKLHCTHTTTQRTQHNTTPLVSH